MKAAIIIFALSTGTMSYAITIATFADPSTGPSQPVFRYNATNKTLRGEWLVDGLTLQHPGLIGGGSTANVRMRMDPVNLTPIVSGTLFSVSSGTVNFWTTNPSAPFFTITFVGGLMTFPTGFGGADLHLDQVAFSGPMMPSNMTGEQFAFSFANVTPTQSGNGYTMSASMTSSAVPEPASLAVVAAGALLAMRRRKSL